MFGIYHKTYVGEIVNLSSVNPDNLPLLWSYSIWMGINLKIVWYVI